MKIFHIADVHINYINGQYNEVVRAKLQSFRKKAFARAVKKAIELNVDIFIIAGDLLDYGEIDSDLEKFLIEQDMQLTQAQIISVICNGNHDCALNINYNNIFNNSIVFEDENVNTYSCNTKNGESIFISGCGFSDVTYYKDPLLKFPKRKPGQYHIGIAHGTLSGTVILDHEPYMPLERDNIKKLDYNYFALGHIHKREYFKDIKAAYAGSIQAKNKKENGIKGGYFVRLDEPEGVPYVDFIELSEVIFETVEHEVSDKVKTFDDLEVEFAKMFNTITSPDSLDLAYKYVIDWRLRGTSQVNDLLKYDDVRGFVENLKKEFDFLELTINYDELSSLVNKDLYIESSPFLSMINKILNDDEQKENFLNYILRKEFLDMSEDNLERKLALESVLNEIKDEWVNRLVTK